METPYCCKGGQSERAFDFTHNIWVLEFQPYFIIANSSNKYENFVAALDWGVSNMTRALALNYKI